MEEGGFWARGGGPSPATAVNDLAGRAGFSGTEADDAWGGEAGEETAEEDAEAEEGAEEGDDDAGRALDRGACLGETK